MPKEPRWKTHMHEVFLTWFLWKILHESPQTVQGRRRWIWRFCKSLSRWRRCKAGFLIWGRDAKPSQTLPQEISYHKSKPKIDAPKKRPIDKDPTTPSVSPCATAQYKFNFDKEVSNFNGESQTDPLISVRQHNITAQNHWPVKVTRHHHNTSQQRTLNTGKPFLAYPFCPTRNYLCNYLSTRSYWCLVTAQKPVTQLPSIY